MRKRYLDILRLFCVILLIPFHTMMMYNTWGDEQYVPKAPLEAASWFVRLSYPWLISLMFAIAGMSARYSLQKRTPAKYAVERLMRLGLPLLTGVLLITPFLSYIADVSNNGYSGGYIAHYAVFFTKLTDFSGYYRGFGLAHLWFLWFLLVISLVVLPVYLFGKRYPRFMEWSKGTVALMLVLGVVQALADNMLNVSSKILAQYTVLFVVGLFVLSYMEWSKWPIAFILVLGVVQVLADDALNFDGRSLAQYFVLFLIGLSILSHEEVQKKLEKFRFAFLAAVLGVGALYVFAIRLDWRGLTYDVPYYLYGYLTMLTLLGFGRRRLNVRNKVLTRAAANSQLYYILHYPILIAAAYFLIPHIPNVPMQIGVLIAVSFVLTVLLAKAVRCIPGVQVLLGVKCPKRTLETRSLILRRWKASDAETLYEFAKNPLIGPVVGWPIRTSVEDSQMIIRDVLSTKETYAVTLRYNDTAIGSIGLLIGDKSNLDIKPNEAEIGYWIAKPYWGQELVPEAIREIMRYAFEVLGMSVLWYGYFGGNKISRKVSEKCGFRFHHAEFDKERPLINTIKTQHVTCITKGEWEKYVQSMQSVNLMAKYLY